MRSLVNRLRHVFGGSRADADLREEIETHRALRQDQLERGGVAAPEAAAASRRALGNVTLAREDVRELWIGRAIDGVRQDLRIVLRGLRNSLGFSSIAIGTLALGIGATTALFSIFNTLVLRPLPVREPERLAYLSGGSWTYPIWEAVDRYSAGVFDGAFAWSNERFNVSPMGQTELVDGAYVSGGIFDVLGVAPARGRLLTRTDDRIGGDAAVAVISHRLWQQRFGGGEAVGQRLTVNRVPFVVVGVMPKAFFGPEVGRMADVMIPFASEPLIRGQESNLQGRWTWWLEIMVRTKSGQTIDQANTAFHAIQPQVRTAALPPNGPADQIEQFLSQPMTMVSAEGGRSSLRGRMETPLTAMIAAVVLVLLIACANIANLLLARALGRQRELSVRLALGASRWRLARLLLIECLVIAFAGAVVGVLFARWSSALLVRQLNTWDDVVMLNLAFDWRVLAFTAGLACLTTIVAGLAPAWGVRHVAPGEVLKDGGRAIVGSRRVALRSALVITQLALSLVLLVAAGLFLRTFATLSRIPLGFRAEGLVTASVNLQGSRVGIDGRGALLEQLQASAAAVQGIVSAATSFITPVTGAGWNNAVIEAPIVPPERRQKMTWLNATTPGWFKTMEIPIRTGRDLDGADRAGAPEVVVVNDAFVRRFFPPNQPPVGNLVRLGGPSRSAQYLIVGVVADAVYRNPREGMMPTAYLPVAQQDEVWPDVALTLRLAPGTTARVTSDVAAALMRVDPAVVVTFHPFDQLVDATVTQERLVAMLSAFFGGLGLLLAAVGLYGVVSHAVQARRTEFGVRMALGASPAGILGLVLRRVCVLLGVGLAIGLAGSYWASGFVRTLLYQLEPRDPVTFGIAAGVLGAVVIAAAALPAWRASRLDPARVLREG